MPPAATAESSHAGHEDEESDPKSRCSSAEPLLVELLELRVGAPEVAARRRDVAVAGEPLRGRHVHLRGPGGDRGVPEPVRRHALGEPGALRGLRDDRLRHLDAHAVRAALFLAPRDEERRVFVLPRSEIALEPLARAHAEEDPAVAAAFAEHGHLVGDTDAVLGIHGARIELELFAIEADELRDTTTSGCQELQKRAVAQAFVGRGVEAFEETLELLLIEVPGVRARVWRLRELDLLGPGHRQIEEHAELQKPAERDEMKILRGGRNWSLAHVAAREEPPTR